MTTRPRNASPVTFILVALALVAAACGQKEGVGGTEIAVGGGGAGVGTGATTADGGTGGGAPAAREAGPDDKNGVTDDEIVIGVHAPVTGASPFPTTSFEVGKDLLWKFLESQGIDVAGRTVRVVFRDDQFNPTRAVQVCREMVEQDNAFLLVGGGGGDQITACAKYADGLGIPYLSPGVNEEGLADLSTYFSISMSYPAQAPILAQLLADQGIERVGVVVIDTPSFTDGQEAFVAAAEEVGLEVVVNDRIGKTASGAEIGAEIQKLQAEDAEAVFLLLSPITFVGLTATANGQSYSPIYVGPGITSGLNAVAEFGCPAIEGAQFLSPFPGLDQIDELDPEYRQAYEEFGDPAEEADDIGLGLWQLNRTLAAMLQATSEATEGDIGRAAFLDTVENGDFAAPSAPPVSYAPDDHIGGEDMHLLKADCGAKVWNTERRAEGVGQ